MLEGCNETQSGQMGSGQWNVDTHVQLAEEEDGSLAGGVKSSPCQKKKRKKDEISPKVFTFVRGRKVSAMIEGEQTSHSCPSCVFWATL